MREPAGNRSGFITVDGNMGRLKRTVGFCLPVVVAMLLLVNAATALESVVFNAVGASDDLRDELRQSSASLKALDENQNNPQDVLAAARSDYGRLLGVLYANGFYGGVIRVLIDGREAAEIAPLSPPPSIDKIAVTVLPGPQFRFSRAQVRPLAPGTDQPEGFAAGRPAYARLIERAVAAGVGGWRDKGFAKADVRRQDIIADHKDSSLDVRVFLDPGPKVTFGTLNVRGNEAIRTDRIYQIAGFPEGADFSPADLRKIAERLRRTGAFRAVVLTEVEKLGPGDTLDVEMIVSEALPRKLGFGAEISSLEGLMLSSYWLHRNFLGGAESLRLDFAIENLGSLQQGARGPGVLLGARLTRPATFGPDTALVTYGKFEQRDEPEYLQTSAEIGAGIRRVFSARLEGEVGLGLRYARFDDAIGIRELQHIVLPASITWDRRNNPTNPTRGFYLKGDARPYIGISRVDTGVRLFANSNALFSIGENDRLTFAGRLQIGAVLGSAISRTPADYLFFSGGSGTVRGQPYKSLGIEIPGGGQTGGRSFLGLSGEIRSMVSRNIGIVGFYDYGYTDANSLPDGSGDAQSGAGVGVRYTTGIGPIRFDVAWPVSGRTSDGRAKVYIGIGQAF